MEFFEVIDKRCSYRGEFMDKEIPDSDIRKIIEAGIKAPSGMNAQSTIFIVVDDEDLRQQIADVLPTPATKTAPVIIVVLSENIITPCGLAFEIEDYAAAVQNMLLAVTALGYKSVWMDGMTKQKEANKKIRKILNVPENKTVRTILPVGIPVKECKQNSRKDFSDRCTYNKFK